MMNLIVSFARNGSLRDGRLHSHRLKGVPRDTSAKFIEPMLLVASETLPEEATWTFELKLDGFRALAIKSSGQARLNDRALPHGSVIARVFLTAYPSVDTPVHELIVRCWREEEMIQPHPFI
jgi:hypothetical protein